VAAGSAAPARLPASIASRAAASGVTPCPFWPSLVSCSQRLMPDSSTKFVLRYSDDKDIVVTGRVVRSKLVAVGGDCGIAYETAIHADGPAEIRRRRGPCAKCPQGRTGASTSALRDRSTGPASCQAVKCPPSSPISATAAASWRNRTVSPRGISSIYTSDFRMASRSLPQRKC
jgi:hypothetical protein